MVAFALRADGWWLRKDNIVAKRNCMPESVEDRTTTSHEYIFHLAKSADYFYDHEAIKEVSATADEAVYDPGTNGLGGDDRRTGASSRRFGADPAKRNKRSVWWIATQPFADAHFATMSQELAAIPIKAGTSERGCCRFCGAPWARVVQRERPNARAAVLTNNRDGGLHKYVEWLTEHPVLTIGWNPTCRCRNQRGQIVPAVVLDPFGGAGTTALVAMKLGRDAILCEPKPEYVAMAERRITDEAPLLNRVVVE